jgi:hypothetical protein
MATWFETRGAAALPTMRDSDLILRSPPPAGVSKDEATEVRVLKPSLRAKRSNPLRRYDSVDCFASLAMTKRTALAAVGVYFEGATWQR